MSDFADSYSVDDAGCWIWRGYADKNGYGRFYNRGRRKIEWAHRYSIEQHLGEPIPPRHEVDHMCQVTLCVNPSHLQVLTKAEHARVTMQRLGKDDLHLAAARMRRGGYTYAEIGDALGYVDRAAFRAVRTAVQKGLIDPAEIPPTPRLSADERDEIRVLYAMGIPQTVIGRFYEVDSSQISRICNGFTSGHGNQEAS
jgi:hypothetical protein